MAGQNSGQAKPAGVSPARKAVSAIILVIAIVVLGVELRAGLGQKQTIDAMAKQSEDGVFTDTKLEDAKAMLVLFPSETVIRDSEMETLYKYSWNSLLRPLMGQTHPELYLVASKSEPSYAISYYTDPDDGSEGFFGDNGTPAGIREELPGDPSGASMGGGGGPPGMPGMGGRPGMGGPPGMPGMGGGNRRRPSADGESAAPAGGGGLSRPPADNPISETPAEGDKPADTPPADTPAADDKPADTPATGDKPAETPTTENPPAGDSPAAGDKPADAPATGDKPADAPTTGDPPTGDKPSDI